MKNIVITGASSGIGYATALSLSKNPDHRVYALARNSKALATLAAAAQQGSSSNRSYQMGGTLFLMLSLAIFYSVCFD